MQPSMTSRQRVLAALNHQEPDRVPVDLGGRHTTMHVVAHRRLQEYLGLGSEEDSWRQFWQQTVAVDPRLNDRLGGDVLCFAPGQPDAYTARPPQDGVIEDEWGTRFRMPPGSYYYDVCDTPLGKAETTDAIDSYPWPDPHDPGRTRGLAEAIRAAHQANQKAIMLAGVPCLWEHGWFLRGIEQSLMDLAINPNFSKKLLDRMLRWEAELWGDMLDQVGEMVDVVALSGDLGTQNGPMVSPKVFRDVLKPRLAELASFVKSKTRAKVYIHSCGSIAAFIPGLIEAGIEVLNPVQITAKDMEPEKLKREFGKDVTFWGGGCSTVTLQYATPEEIRLQVQTNIRALAPGGGYVFGPIHNIQALVPPQNIVALFEAAKEFGSYPVT